MDNVSPESFYFSRLSWQINTIKGDVSVMGIDGSFDITVSEGDIKLQLNKLNSSSSKQLSTAVAQVGNVAVTVDPEVILQSCGATHFYARIMFKSIRNFAIMT